MQLFDLTIQVKCPYPSDGSVLEKYSAGAGHFPILTESKIKNLTVSDVHFPLGMNTVIVSGDFEGNYTHQKHELQHDCGKICLAYEMHEGQN